MIAVLFATKMEAAPFLADLTRAGALMAAEERFPRFRAGHSEGAVGIIGMGPEAAAEGTARILEDIRPLQAVNAGIAGALSDSLELGAAYRISTATMAGDDPRGVAFDALGFDALPAARLVTSPVPVFEDTLRKQLRVRGDAVDMEGAVVGRLCAAANTPCAAVKCISDFAKAGDRETLHRNLKQASGALSAVLCERLGIQ